MKNKKLKIAVILGGTSSEREVSLATGEHIFKNLDRKKYIPKKYDPKNDLHLLFEDAKNKKIDLAFIALHGKMGEDGMMQGLLEMLEVSYTGSGVLASALAMHKISSKKIFIKHKLATPSFVFFTKSEYKKAKKDILSEIKVPCVVKPNDSGSSVGISVVKKRDNLEKAIKKALTESDEIIVEKFIEGVELTVPVLDKKTLPVVEIIPKKDFFDYQAKYEEEWCDEIVPARISTEITKKVQKIALEAHQSLYCRHYSRVDIILDRKGKLWVLEVNSLPGMTPNSLIPKSAAVAGINFPQLLDKIINLARK